MIVKKREEKKSLDVTRKASIALAMCQLSIDPKLSMLSHEKLSIPRFQTAIKSVDDSAEGGEFLPCFLTRPKIFKKREKNRYLKAL